MQNCAVTRLRSLQVRDKDVDILEDNLLSSYHGDPLVSGLSDPGFCLSLVLGLHAHTLHKIFTKAITYSWVFTPTHSTGSPRAHTPQDFHEGDHVLLSFHAHTLHRVFTPTHSTGFHAHTLHRVFTRTHSTRSSQRQSRTLGFSRPHTPQGLHAHTLHSIFTKAITYSWVFTRAFTYY